MTVFRRLVYAALCAGVFSGVLAAGAHQLGSRWRQLELLDPSIIRLDQSLDEANPLQPVGNLRDGADGDTQRS